ncbi:hypothetical protein KUTeg_005482 [Tegillarca granosa]|uniref:Ig-like domain-containing protein n=1 Tax=Tegillarca granosa TaxID=220873 RepID=A0ABQ9FPE2_TEGGR|nr:hypothetical protein KUTeg_005482 [Tegillarca granosa]
MYNDTQREIKTTGISESSTSSNLTIHRVKCEDMGTYSCLLPSNATNELIKSLNISVKCKPIIQMKNPQRNRSMAKVGETLVLSVFVFAFPKPQIKWYFREITSRSRLMVADTDTKDYLNRYVSSVTFRRLQDKDFGTYFVNATNTVGSTVFTIMIEKASVMCLLFSLICAIRFCKKRQVYSLIITVNYPRNCSMKLIPLFYLQLRTDVIVNNFQKFLIKEVVDIAGLNWFSYHKNAIENKIT